MKRAKSSKKARRTAFVPRMVLGVTVVGVIPACVSACTGNRMVATVAEMCFTDGAQPACQVSVADAGFQPDTGMHDANNSDVPIFTVADAGFQPEASPADVSQGPDVIFTVAVCTFCDAGNNGNG
jgi:hypothetical protein